MERSGSKVLVLGKTGQIGHHLISILGARAIAAGRNEIDLSDIPSLSQKIRAVRPNVILNAAAYTQVDQAEVDRELAMRVNGEALKVLAELANDLMIPLIHYSTDYVYDGLGSTARKESDPTQPVNFYGETKLRGEDAIRESGCPHLIFRTAWVYDSQGTNFVLKMLELAKSKPSLSIVYDQVGSPSYAKDIATYSVRALDEFLKEQSLGGIYHLTNSGFVSWFEFAQHIFKGAKALQLIDRIPELKPISSEEFRSRAKRPKNSRLDLQHLNASFHIKPRPWQEALDECLQAIADAK